MKRYRGENANYHRLGSAFVPSCKWGKRIKRRLKEATRGEAVIVRDPITPANYEEVAALIETLWSPLTPIVTVDSSKARQWVWTPAQAKIEYTLPEAQDPKPFYADAYEHKYR